MLNGYEVLASDEFEIVTITTDLSLSVESHLHNGLQEFSVNIANISIYSTDAILNVYCNGEIIRQINFSLDSNRTVNFDLTFDNLKANDYLYFEIVTAIEDSSALNNGMGVYSMCDSPILKAEIKNPYIEILEAAKGLLI